LNVISKIIKNNVRKKVDGRKFNGGNKGCGRKSKSDERQLVENLHHLKMKHLLYYSKKVLEVIKIC
jgi:hypothetical protein